MKTHAELRAAARTYNNEPTLTDQSGRQQTDLNIILQQAAITGTMPSNGKEPQYHDWTLIPRDLRGMLELREKIEEHRARLPEKLREIPLEKLMEMTDAEINATLQPPAPPPDKPKDEPK